MFPCEIGVVGAPVLMVLMLQPGGRDNVDAGALVGLVVSETDV